MKIHCRRAEKSFHPILPFNSNWEKDAPLLPFGRLIEDSDSHLHENYFKKCNIARDEFELLQKQLLMQNKYPAIQNLKTSGKIENRKQNSVNQLIKEMANVINAQAKFI